MKNPYDEKFYNEILTDSYKSASVIIPLVNDLVHPKSVVDVGCGTGEFLHFFKENGINNILGVDGKWVNVEQLRIPEEFFKSADLEKPYKLNQTFDLVVSLEVAEHLPIESSEIFVETLTNLGPVVLFSAAIPFQGGVNHLNEQWPEFWADLFSKKGFVAIDCIREKLWNNENVSIYYAQNIILYVKKDILNKNNELLSKYEEYKNRHLSMVHPKLFLQKSKQLEKIMKVIPNSVKWLRKIIK